MNLPIAIRARHSVREYAPAPVEKAILDDIFDLVSYAPSACNRQPWAFYVVTNADLKVKIAWACHKQAWIGRAPVIIVGCATDRAFAHMGGGRSSGDIDVAIALDHLSLAAVHYGLSTCWIGAFSYDKLAKLVDIAPTERIVALMTLGYPAPGESKASGRKPLKVTLIP